MLCIGLHQTESLLMSSGQMCSCDYHELHMMLLCCLSLTSSSFSDLRRMWGSKVILGLATVAATVVATMAGLGHAAVDPED